ncbi:Methane oxygenase PmoA [Planctomycetales bacterium 10988]|nr:Methane oxygenase PmoA [Planctomycetales bacterium 10988]
MISLTRMLTVSLLSLSLLLATSEAAEEFTVDKTEHGVTVKLGEYPFAKYDIVSGPKPFVWPIYGPGGVEMTRAYPMEDRPGESQDHPHHRSLWIGQELVNGVNYWHEEEHSGKIVHRKFTKTEGGKKATIQVVNDWLDVEGHKILEDRTTYQFLTLPNDKRAIDVTFRLKASEGPITWGDTKEGFFAVRVASSMEVKGKTNNSSGTIVTSEGKKSYVTPEGDVVKDAWGTRAKWVDYYGDVAGETKGIAVLNHPSSFRYPTYWHVRVYGLFGANPFGEKAFTGNEEADGTYVQPEGETLMVRYRVIFHNGTTEEANIEKEFEKYAKVRAKQAAAKKKAKAE